MDHASADGSIHVRKQANQRAGFHKPPDHTITERRRRTTFRYAKILYKRSVQYVDTSQSDDLRKALRHYAVNYAYMMVLTSLILRISIYALVPAVLTAGVIVGLAVAHGQAILVAYSIGISALVIIVLIFIFTGSYNSRTIRRYPEAPMTYCLIRVLRHLEGGGVKRGDAPSKARICADLQLASRFLEVAIPIAVGLPDPAARQRFKDRCHSGAVELRDMQAQIALTDEGTVDNLSQVIVRYISMVTQGKYGLLPPEAPPEIKEAKTSTFARISRNVLVAIIPISCLIGARLADLKIAGQLADWAIIIAVAWAAITLISTLDPAYKAKIDDIRNIVSIMRGDNG
jgi:hypothetical protein